MATYQILYDAIREDYNKPTENAEHIHERIKGLKEVLNSTYTVKSDRPIGLITHGNVIRHASKAPSEKPVYFDTKWLFKNNSPAIDATNG
jgi:hypothetical protein